MSRSPVQVFFVYRRSATHLGTTQMRGFQLCEILRRHGSGRFTYTMKPLPKLHFDPLRHLWASRQPRGAVYVFIKDAIARLHPAALAQLQVRASAVLLDHIDRSLDSMPMAGVDLHLASSQAQFDALAARLKTAGKASGSVGLLLHQADLRLSGPINVPRDQFRPAYFGNPINAFLPARVAARVPLIDVGLAGGMQAHLETFGTANLHYAVRPIEQTRHATVFKPLTKAVTAAACGVPVLVNRDAPDAEALLGTDYPYLLDRVTEADTLEMLDNARSGFGGSEWVAALDKMRALGARVSPEQTAATFERILETIL